MISALTPVPYLALHSFATGCAGGLCTRVPHVSPATLTAGTPTRLIADRQRRCPINQPTSSSWHVALTKLDFTFTDPAYATSRHFTNIPTPFPFFQPSGMCLVTAIEYCRYFCTRMCRKKNSLLEFRKIERKRKTTQFCFIDSDYPSEGKTLLIK